MEFSRGDGIHHYFAIEAASWVSGGRLFFGAKQAIGDDTDDSTAVIEQTWDDTAVSDVTIDGVAYKQWDCYFPPAATYSIDSGGAQSLEYLGEFQIVPASGDPVTYPANDPKITVTVYFDVIRKIAP